MIVIHESSSDKFFKFEEELVKLAGFKPAGAKYHLETYIGSAEFGDLYLEQVIYLHNLKGKNLLGINNVLRLAVDNKRDYENQINALATGHIKTINGVLKKLYHDSTILKRHGADADHMVELRSAWFKEGGATAGNVLFLLGGRHDSDSYEMRVANFLIYIKKIPSFFTGEFSRYIKTFQTKPIRGGTSSGKAVAYSKKLRR